MPDLEPITRTEKLWSGEDLDPVTRKEMYIKHLYDETQVIPDHPVTREEIFILKAGEELHDVTIEQLTATENGTYSEQGVAYSPVIVDVPEPTLITKSITENGTYSAEDDNADGYSSVDVDVPLPENAYLNKSLSGLPADIATFNDGEALPLSNLKVGIEAVQSGSGEPSPSNPRPISGWTGANVGVVGKNWCSTNFTEGKGILTSGTISNNPNRSATVEAIRVLPNSTYTVSYTGSDRWGWFAYNSNDELIESASWLYSGDSFTTPLGTYYVRFLYSSGTAPTNVQLELGETSTTYAPYNGHIYVISFGTTYYGGWLDVVNGKLYAYPYYASYNGETLVGEWISSLDAYAEGTTPTTGAQVLNIGAEPTVIDISTPYVKALEGVNNLFADCGQVQELSYFSKEV